MGVRRERPTGAFGWLMIFAVAAAYEGYALKTSKVETLSSAFWRWGDHPLGALATVAVWGIVSYHLVIDNRVRRILGR